MRESLHIRQSHYLNFVICSWGIPFSSYHTIIINQNTSGWTPSAITVWEESTEKKCNDNNNPAHLPHKTHPDTLHLVLELGTAFTRFHTRKQRQKTSICTSTSWTSKSHISASPMYSNADVGKVLYCSSTSWMECSFVILTRAKKVVLLDATILWTLTLEPFWSPHRKHKEPASSELSSVQQSSF